MSVERLLRSRHMCRDFSDADVTDSAVDALVSAALGAPAAGNTAGIDLVVLRGPEQTSKYWDVSLPEGPRRQSFRWPGLLKAPLLVVLVVDPQAYADRYSQPDKAHSGLGESAENWQVPYWFFDAGAAAMAMLITAEAEGIGALLFGQFDHEDALSRALGIPDGLRSAATLAFGYRAPGEDSLSASARSGRPRAQDRVHNAAW